MGTRRARCRNGCQRRAADAARAGSVFVRVVVWPFPRSERHVAGIKGGDRPLVERPAENSLSRGLLDFFLPISCVVCERLVPHAESGIVCGHCWSRVVELPHPRCARCGHPRGRHDCSWCEFLPPFVRAARSYCWVSAGTGGEVVHALKYSGWKAVAKPMSERIADRKSVV